MVWESAALRNETGNRVSANSRPLYQWLGFITDLCAGVSSFADIEGTAAACNKVTQDQLRCAVTMVLIMVPPTRLVVIV